MAEKLARLNLTTGRIERTAVEFLAVTDPITNLNGTDIANIAPSVNGQLLTYNATLDQWEPAAPSATGGSITVRDIDLSPTVTNVTTLEFTNGAVQDMGSGVVQVTVSGGSSGGDTNPGGLLYLWSAFI